MAVKMLQNELLVFSGNDSSSNYKYIILYMKTINKSICIVSETSFRLSALFPTPFVLVIDLSSTESRLSNDLISD